MNKFIIEGKQKLCGTLTIPTAKNALLPILAATILAEGDFVINNVTKFSDVYDMCNILKSIGIECVFNNNSLKIKTCGLNSFEILKELGEKIRASIFCLGPILAKFKKARFAFPGGCKIGPRPIDIHLDGLSCLGVKIFYEDEYVVCDANDAKANSIYLRFPSVGATENLVMFSTLLNGETKIFNSAKEPEVVDLCNFLNKMGAKISGHGTNCITITGVSKLYGTIHEPVSDRIVAGTYLLYGASCGGEIALCNAFENHNKKLVKILKEYGCKIFIEKSKIMLTSNLKKNVNKNIQVLPYPGFPTDLQPQMVAFMSICEGLSTVTEKVFNQRFNYVNELCKMGANIKIAKNKAFVNGEKTLFGTNVHATDLRAGAALVLAGLNAQGQTTISGIEYIDRGYFKLEKQLSLLGAKIRRTNEK